VIESTLLCEKTWVRVLCMLIVCFFMVHFFVIYWMGLVIM